MKPRFILPSKTKYGKVITCFVVLKVFFNVKTMVAQSLYCFHRTRIKSDEKSWAWYLCIGHFYHCWQWLISFSINRIIVIVSQREVTLKMTIAFTLQDVYTRDSVKQWIDRVFFFLRANASHLWKASGSNKVTGKNKLWIQNGKNQN